jgi:AraC-like DNA-binding protein
MEMYEAELLSALHILSSSRITLFDTSHPISATLNRCMSDACSEFESKDVCYMLNTKANIYLMMSALLRHFCSSKNDDDRIVYHNVLRLRPAIEYIDANFYDKLYIDELAQIIKVSTDYFTKMFGECIGKTPVEYINNKRINRAMQLLVGTEDSMADIAAKIGFCNANYFHKIFKSYMNKSPLQYRKVYKVK